MHLFSFDIVLLSKHLLLVTYKAVTITGSFKLNEFFK